MSIYRLFGTDKSRESDGVWFDYGDGVQFKLARAGGGNTEYAKARDRRFAPHRRTLDRMPNDQLTKIMAEVFAEAVVKDWKGVTNEHGEPLACNHANVVKILVDLPDLFAQVQREASEMSYFRAAEIEADAGN